MPPAIAGWQRYLHAGMEGRSAPCRRRRRPAVRKTRAGGCRRSGRIARRVLKSYVARRSERGRPSGGARGCIHGPSTRAATPPPPSAWVQQLQPGLAPPTGSRCGDGTPRMGGRDCEAQAVGPCTKYHSVVGIPTHAARQHGLFSEAVGQRAGPRDGPATRLTAPCLARARRCTSQAWITEMDALSPAQIRGYMA